MKRFTLILMALVFAGLASLPAQQLTPYGKMRTQFAASPNFDPFKLQIIEHQMIVEAGGLWEERKAGDAVEVLRALLEIYPLSLGVHRRLAEAYEALARDEKEKDQKERYTVIHRKHNEAYTGLIESIMSGRDGRSAESAFPVITFAEEYWVLLKLGAAPKDRKMDEKTKIAVYDVIDTKGDEYQLFFDVTRVLEAKATQPKAQ